MNILRTLLILASTIWASLASDYADDGNWDGGGGYGSYDDSMGDYFDKAGGGGAIAAAGGNHLMKIASGASLGWFLGAKIHSRRAANKLKKKHSKERAAFVQLYREQVGALQEFNKESSRIIRAMESSIIARNNGVPAEIDTVPFFMADTDGSKKISKAEFDRYVREYLVNYPGLRPEDIPRWESFDHDHSGSITFDEYNQQMMKEIRKAQYRAAKT
ncbi:hypothetical protein ACHAXA_000470 [Cyclostephanos tholiformis]|uniref:EF-hand domain-containing protein n=1 Tax=Cyclostephanos tholiformis TaxID=382380 RepID=A0ABD3RLE6_9STRA